MIHDIKYYYLKYLNNQNILTFDDGLYSVYYFRNKLKKINTKKIIFIPTERILLKRESSPIFVDCYKANKMWSIYKDNSAYMTIDEIKELHDMGFIIGGHSHFHKRNYKNLDDINNDIELMLNWFRKNLSFTPEYYAFPYNKENIFLKKQLIKNGIIHFYGNERISLENFIISLLKNRKL